MPPYLTAQKQAFPKVLVTPGTNGTPEQCCRLVDIFCNYTISPVFSGSSNPKGWISVNDRN